MIKLFQILFSPLVFIYGLIVRTRNFLFDKNIFKQKKVSAKIISVGNLTVGGSGKTPSVIKIINILKSQNKRVGVLSRGYGRKSKGYMLVSDGKNILDDTSLVGDEIILVAKECGVPAAVSEKRYEGCIKFLNDVPLDIIILDDAFQHRWIYRDVNILIFDQKFLTHVSSFEQKLLPLGLMREKFDAVKRADIIVINKKFSSEQKIPTKLWKYFINKEVHYCYYHTSRIVDIKNQTSFSLEEFVGQKSLVVCGIAKPFSFIQALNKYHINTDNKLIFRDHKEYSQKEIQTIRKKFYDTNSNCVLTTQKDAVKLSHFSKELDDVDIYYLKIDLQFENEEKFFNKINSLINNKE